MATRDEETSMSSEQAGGSPQSSSSAERRRVAGVLAQRRYRQRKKEHLRNLEAAAAGHVGKESSMKMDGRAADKASNAWDPTPELMQTLIPMQCSAKFNDPLPSNGLFTDIPELDLWDSLLQPDTTNDLFGNELAEMELSQFHFPDDSVLEVPELETIKTATEFAKLLQCEDTLWSLGASRILNLSPSETSNLPTVLQPTPAQRQVLHHPALDILPWPSVRNKLIIVFSQPPELRPPNARDEMALLRLIYDLDDSAEGLRVSGQDRLDLGNWEIGQVVFQNWWWAFDNQILHTSNLLRARRGAPRLRITNG